MQSNPSLPLVAIITPVYNGAKFLRECMESVQALDYPNVVHVILDNASTDETPDIIASFAGRRVPIVTRRNANLIPMVPNWNAVVRMVPAEAKYFHLLCADDTLKPYGISRQVEIAERDPEIGWVGCLRRAEGQICGAEIPKDREVFDGEELMRSYFRREHSGLSGMFALIRTSKIDPDIDFYDPVFVCSIDVDANLRVISEGKAGFIHDELVYWREHQGQVTEQVQRGRHILFEWLPVLDRYGPFILGYREYEACRRAYRRHYLRQLLVIRFKENDKQVFDWHIKQLKARDDAAGLWDFADALIDWAGAAITGKRHEVGISHRRSFGAPVLLPKFVPQ